MNDRIVINTGPDVTYRWKVVGGRILGGKETPSITVRVNKSNTTKEVIATVAIGNLEEDALCPSAFSYTTKIRP